MQMKCPTQETIAHLFFLLQEMNAHARSSTSGYRCDTRFTISRRDRDTRFTVRGMRAMRNQSPGMRESYPPSMQFSDVHSLSKIIYKTKKSTTFYY